MDLQAVESSYARWAPVYDKTFGAVTRAGRRRAVDYINTRTGRVLEVGVGTGLSLRHYNPTLEVTGIDFSADMLEKARKKVRERKLDHVKALLEMDARTLEFPDDHFDTVAAMHIVSVVPEPERVVAEMARVCKPGGKIVITNHFSRDKGFLSVAERLSAPFANLLGWHSDFPMGRVTDDSTLRVVEQAPLPPFGMMTFLLLEKPVLSQ
jgi:phosphatidylethanolamine/phosphatidyl-N-methylethanolamine N-methyltransferase